MKVHELKIESKYFNEVWNERKLFEIRKNDRDYQIGDLILLKPIMDDNDEYGLPMFVSWDSRIIAGISYITDYAQKNDYVVFGITVLGRKPHSDIWE